MPKDPKRKRGRPPKGGRPSSQHNKERKKVLDARHLFVKKDLSEQEAALLEELLEAHPALRVQHDFAQQVYALFDASDLETAETLRQAILADRRFLADSNLAKSVARLEDDIRFRKLMLHTSYENLDRTSNHVERDNRRFRKRQKSHYRLRLERTIRNALNLKLREERAAKAGQPVERLEPRPTKAPV